MLFHEEFLMDTIFSDMNTIQTFSRISTLGFWILTICPALLLTTKCSPVFLFSLSITAEGRLSDHCLKFQNKFSMPKVLTRILNSIFPTLMLANVCPWIPLSLKESSVSSLSLVYSSFPQQKQAVRIKRPIVCRPVMYQANDSWSFVQAFAYLMMPKHNYIYLSGWMIAYIAKEVTLLLAFSDILIQNGI